MMKNKILRIMSLVIVLSMIFTTVAFAAPKHKQFEHFNKNYELKTEDYEDALKALISKSIVKGYGNGDYGLSGNVKRGDVIVMIIRMLEKYDFDISIDDVKDTFEDVYQTDYFYDSIKKAKKLGIAKGDGKYFNPNKPVTLQEAIWLIERAGEALGLEFEDDSIDELEEIYKDELNKHAKRRDVFWVLYYVLDDVDFDDKDKDEVIKFNDIKLNIEKDNELDFLDSWFKRAYDAKIDDDNDELEYVKFELPEEGGNLYYDYDVDAMKNSLVSEKTKYYLDDDEDNIVRNITFVPDKYFKGTVTIGYTAFADDDSYTGLIKITVESVQDIPTLKFTTDYEDEYIDIDIEDKLEDLIIDNKPVDIDDIDYVKFGLPEKGTLKIKLEDKRLTSVIKHESYELDDIEYIRYEFVDDIKVNINYTVYEEKTNTNDKGYNGLFIIDIR